VDTDVLTTADAHAASAEARRAARPATTREPSTTDPLWWRSAVIYQVYVRSFADGNADGTGDLAGVRARLPYLKRLGVDALWFNPWYASPLADGGYDVADYRAIHPQFGTLAEAEALISEALELGIRTIIDVVPNHISDRHPWFQAALAAGPGSPERERFWFHPGKGANGDEMPTHWVSNFQGETWTRTTNPDGTPGEWYLHLFAPQQPDLNWNHPDVRREHEDILRFWFDRGVAGVRIDSAALLIKDADLPEVGEKPEHPSCTTCTGPGVRSPTPTPAPASSSARSGCPTSSGSRTTCGPTRCTRPSTSTSSRGRGGRHPSAPPSTRRSEPTRRSARRRRGS
jgi:alpha-glucosidase